MAMETCERVMGALGGLCGQSFWICGEKYRVVSLIAEGGFGSVFLVQGNGKNRGKFAVKRLLAQSQEQLRDAKWEIRVHKTLGNGNVNVIPLLASDSARVGPRMNQVLLLYPLFDGGTMIDLLLHRAKRGQQLSDREAVELFLQVANGLMEFHKQDPPLAHRDIKPHNVLLSNNGTAVLMDFGSTAIARVDTSTRSSRLALQERASKCCSMAYRAPELWEPSEDEVVDERSDIWSMGCLLFSMIFGQGYSPFECSFSTGVVRQRVVDPFGAGSASSTGPDGIPTANPRDCTYLAVIGTVPLPEKHSRPQALVDLLLSMLQIKPSKRPTLATVVDQMNIVKQEHISLY